MSDINNPIFITESAARKHLEAIRWREDHSERFCPHCGVLGNTSPVQSKAHGAGFYYCLSCKKTFTVTVGTIFERSHVPLNKWLFAFHMMAASKKGVSAHQLHRMLGVTYKTAWFMAHRIREAMRDGFPSPLGGNGTALEVDETYLGPTTYTVKKGPGGKTTVTGNRGYQDKAIVLTLVERGGRSRSIHVEKLTKDEIARIVRRNTKEDSVLNTDDAGWYKMVGGDFIFHNAVNHSKGEYARGEAHTNTVEGFFSIFKRGMRGVYQHCSEKHLQRYLDEFDFRYSHRAALGVTDSERMIAAIRGAEGKRLMYRQADSGAAA